MNNGPINILLAEDDLDDCYLIGEALSESNVPHKLFIVNNGEELMDYLYNRNKYKDTDKWPRPGLILLDLNMPLRNGIDALEEIKNDPGLKRIPIVVLTTSQSEEDVIQTYEMGISSYISKPMTFTALVDAMRSLGEYWDKLVKLPPE
jgi:CheY-like chemotaxis protein